MKAGAHSCVIDAFQLLYHLFENTKRLRISPHIPYHDRHLYVIIPGSSDRFRDDTAKSRTWFFSCASIIDSASSLVNAIGFSMNTAFPVSAAATAKGACVVMVTLHRDQLDESDERWLCDAHDIHQLLERKQHRFPQTSTSHSCSCRLNQSASATK